MPACWLSGRIACNFLPCALRARSKTHQRFRQRSRPATVACAQLTACTKRQRKNRPRRTSLRLDIKSRNFFWHTCNFSAAGDSFSLSAQHRSAQRLIYRCTARACMCLAFQVASPCVQACPVKHRGSVQHKLGPGARGIVLMQPGTLLLVPNWALCWR